MNPANNECQKLSSGWSVKFAGMLQTCYKKLIFHLPAWCCRFGQLRLTHFYFFLLFQDIYSVSFQQSSHTILHKRAQCCGLFFFLEDQRAQRSGCASEHHPKDQNMTRRATKKDMNPIVRMSSRCLFKNKKTDSCVIFCSRTFQPF